MALYTLYTDSPQEAWFGLTPSKPLSGDEVAKAIASLEALATTKKTHAKGP